MTAASRAPHHDGLRSGTFHHRHALNPRLFAADIEALLPIVAAGLQTRSPRGDAAVTRAAAQLDTPRNLVEQFAAAEREVKAQRLQALVAQSATHYESAHETESSARSGRTRRPTSAALLRTLGTRFDLNALTATIPPNPLHERLLGHSSAAPATTATQRPRPPSAKRAQAERNVANHTPQQQPPPTTELFLDGHAAPPAAAAAGSSGVEARPFPIPHPPRRPTTAPAVPSSKDHKGGTAQPSSASRTTADDDALEIGEDDDVDGADHAAETATFSPASKPRAAPAPPSSAPPMQRAASATKGTARIIPVAARPPGEAFFLNFGFFSIRDFLRERKRVEFGSYGASVRQHLAEARAADAETPRLPTARECADAQVAAERETAAAASATKKLSAVAAAHERQERSVARLSQQKMSAVLASSKRLTSTLKRRPASAKR